MQAPCLPDGLGRVPDSRGALSTFEVAHPNCWLQKYCRSTYLTFSPVVDAQSTHSGPQSFERCVTNVRPGTAPNPFLPSTNCTFPRHSGMLHCSRYLHSTLKHKIVKAREPRSLVLRPVSKHTCGHSRAHITKIARLLLFA